MRDTDRESQAAASVVGGGVRVVAAVLAALFEHDQRLAVRLGAAQSRLLGAVDLLRVGVSRDAARALLGPAGADEWLVAALESGTAAGAVDAVGDSIRRAFAEYRHVAEERRQLAADVGEATVRLVDALIAAGFSEAQARTADVQALRDGVYRQGAERCTA